MAQHGDTSDKNSRPNAVSRIRTHPANRPRNPPKRRVPAQATQEAINYKVDAASYDYTCYIVAGGPSLRGFDWSLLTPDKFVIAINRSYEVLPNAQIVYFTDADFWERHKVDMMKHKGQLIRGVENPANHVLPPRVIKYYLNGPHGFETQPGCLRHGSNSTYAALNLAAAHLGFTTIYLLGLDMHWGKPGDKSTSHWHDGHKRVDPETVYNRMIVNFTSLVEPLKQKGVKVYNASMGSSVKAFPKIPLTSLFTKETNNGN